MKKINIANKVVLVSGANRGIGKAIVKELIKQAAKKVYAGARDIKSLDPLIAEFGKKVTPLQLDITNSSSINRAVQVAKEVEILINNAGVIGFDGFAQGGLTQGFKNHLSVNLFGTVELTEKMLPIIKSKEAGAVATISSIVGLAAMPISTTYSSSKAAIHNVIQSLRAELSKTNILVSGIYPGPIDTDMTKMVEMEKDSPENVAKAVVDGIRNGDEYIFPDVMSKQFGEIYMKSPKKAEAITAAWQA